MPEYIVTEHGLERFTGLQAGDFVKPKCGGFRTFFLVKRGSIKFGKGWIEGWIVRDANGRQDFIPTEDIEFIAR